VCITIHLLACYAGELPDSDVSALVDSCIKEIGQLQQERAAFRFFDLAKMEDRILLIGANLHLDGADIARHSAHSNRPGLPIIDPLDQEMMDTGFASRLLWKADRGAELKCTW